ncbi:MAG TPA: DUF423 domain-containing protein [Polyangiaceae bacterium]|nr:DUF423 domain-containing protein [Polyangiaceae bacterium]
MRLTRVAGTVGALAVAAGAFGAHWLSSRVDPALMEAYRTGVQYHLLHSVALLALGLHQERTEQAAAVSALSAKLMLTGVLLFSGSLYALALTGIVQFGYLTPLGGLLLIAAWLQIARTINWTTPQSTKRQ